MWQKSEILRKKYLETMKKKYVTLQKVGNNWK